MLYKYRVWDPKRRVVVESRDLGLLSPHSRQARDEMRTPNTTLSTPFVLLKEISLVCEVVVMNILFFGYLCDWECTTYSTVLNGEGIHKHKHKHNLDL